MGLSRFFQEEFYVPFLHWLDWFEDRKRGINTQQNFELADLGISSHLGNKYQPVGYGRLNKVIKLARIINPKSTFFDVGCGLGRPILVALELGFQHAIGIDVSKELIGICEKNIGSKSNRVKLVCCDIDDYVFPGGVLTIFLFNPFGKDRLAKLLSKLSSIGSTGLIIYFNPKYHEVFDKRKLVKELKWWNFGLFEERCHFYQI
jgi:SAM-dependent methyltransferase